MNDPNDPRFHQQWQQQQYPQYPPPQQYYPAPPIAYAAPQNDSEATTIFVLGIVGVTACGLCAPIAWAKGSSYRRTCRVMGTTPNSLATAGWIMGIIGTALFGISMIFMVIAIALS